LRSQALTTGSQTEYSRPVPVIREAAPLTVRKSGLFWNRIPYV